MGCACWVGAAEEVMIGLVGAALGRTTARAGVEEPELLDLKRKDFVDPFRKALLLGEGEGQ